MRILIAPNAFKHALSADEVARAIRDGLSQSTLSHESILFPIGDGGDGTGKLLTTHLNGEWLYAVVHDPIRTKIQAGFGWINESSTAVIEMAEASGLRLMTKNQLDPMRSNSYGTGELIRAALDLKATKIFLCVGGTATIDGACGILRALGVHFLDARNETLEDLPKELSRLNSLDLSQLDKRIHNCSIQILCDVDNPMLGNRGAAKIFGPQKGANEKDIVILDSLLTKLNDVIRLTTGKEIGHVTRGGAAGGVAAALHGILGAQLVSGIDYFLAITQFEQALKNIDIVITGEGSIDEQTLQGKGPMGVAVLAKKKGIKVIGMAGQAPTKNLDLFKPYFDLIMPITDKSVELTEALKNTGANLIKAARKIGNMIADSTTKLDNDLA
jgi:glycerate kinase